ncbi:DUF3566 domain-containing protein [Streptomyces rubellomurinus]|uniref:DUF3566 domain-containing protein n=2 Tax=Streptomyces TaxID=1883 RepID=A0A0F2TG61_STRR3|nr:DUF3566 domain-containing protein [Streptomyces rubellomurinus]KJS54186.1 hypothetical protein VM98_20745 [Streptomyces rubellomurinus subsp. indigoferus]KJS60697.1 hypothetical protein VM95_19900 [Streptomyces rubellomurinus]
MSGATGAAGGPSGGRPGAQGGGSYGVPQPPTEHSAASTSLMPPVGGSGQTYGGQTPPPPSSPAGGSGGFSQPTTYTKGQPTPARGTRTGGNTPPGGTPVPGAARRPAGSPAPAGGFGRTRKARLRVTKVDPWSVMKVSFLLSVAVGIIIIVAAAVLWMTLDSLGVFDSLTKTMKDVTGGGAENASSALNLMDYIGFGKVMLFTTLIAVVDIVLLTALSTLSAFIYNAAAGFTGGIELTLAEEE